MADFDWLNGLFRPVPESEVLAPFHPHWSLLKLRVAPFGANFSFAEVMSSSQIETNIVEPGGGSARPIRVIGTMVVPEPEIGDGNEKRSEIKADRGLRYGPGRRRDDRGGNQ